MQNTETDLYYIIRAVYDSYVRDLKTTKISNHI